MYTNIIEEKWDEIMDRFKNEFEIHPASFKTFIEPIKVHKLEGNNITLTSSDSMSVKIISKNYLKLIEVAVCQVMNDEYTVSIISPEELLKEQNNNNSNPSELQSERENKLNLNPNYTFENFIVGSNNNLAHAASLAVAESPADMYNPLFLHGGVGLGKTHLMQAIAHFIIKMQPDLKVLYVTSETFTNELIQSVKTSKNTDFRDKYRNIDVLLIDDIQFIIGKESTQEEFFHTFNELYQNNKQIVITSDKPPKEMETLTERLKTRFSEGLICDIQIPTYETKMAILDKKIEEKHLYIPFEVRDYVSTNIKSSIRELEGAITKLSAYSLLSNTPITLDLAKDALKDLVSPDHKRVISAELIIDIVADHFNINPSEISSKNRSANVSYPRQIAMYLCRQMTQESADDIAKKLGKNDHSTVLYGAKKISDALLNDEELKNTINILINKIDPS